MESNKTEKKTIIYNSINIYEIISSLSRNKRLFFSIIFLSVISSITFAVTKKPIWEGYFQIVLAQNSDKAPVGSSMGDQLAISTLFNNSRGKKLETEVKILESPAVLKPVYNFVKKTKEEKGEDVAKLTYLDWVNTNLEVELEDGTFVLRLFYRDNDKDLVPKVITKISEAYQSYSGRDRQKTLNLGINYLDNQITIYREKSSEALRKAQNYANQNDLTPKSAFDDKAGFLILDEEKLRIRSSNEIKNINLQIDKFKEISDNPDLVLNSGFISNLGPANEAYASIDQLDKQLAFAKAIYMPNDIEIKNLEKRREIFINIAKKKTLDFLVAKRIDAETKMEAAKRPEEILIKYKELAREFLISQGTLQKLEREKTKLSLEKSRITEPWELITQPTLKERAVSPRKLRITALGVILGTILGTSASIFADHKSNKIFDIDELKVMANYPILLSINNEKNIEWSINILKQFLISSHLNNSIELVSFGIKDLNLFKTITNKLITETKEKNIKVIDDITNISKDSVTLVFTSLGNIRKDEIDLLNQNFRILKKEIEGIIVV